MNNLKLTQLSIVALTLTMIVLMSYAIMSSGSLAEAQELGTATPDPTPTAEADVGGGSEGRTVLVETCAFDEGTGELSCEEQLEPAGRMTPRTLPPEGKGGGGSSARGCYFDPGMVAQTCSEELDVSGLAPTLRITGTNRYASDSFTVEGDFLSRSHTYRMRVKRQTFSNRDIGFSSSCYTSVKTANVDRGAYDYYDYEHDFTLYGCSERGGTVIVELLKNGIVILRRQETVEVVDRRATPTPRPTATATATATATPTAVPAYPDPPTGLELSTDDNDEDRLELDYDRSESPHYYEFELHMSYTRNSTYRDVQTKDDTRPGLFFDDLTQGKWYRARGRNCRNSNRTECGEWNWSNKKWLPFTPQLHPYSPPVRFRIGGGWHKFYVGADPNLSLKIVANPTGQPVVFVMSQTNRFGVDLCRTKRQNQTFSNVFSGNDIWVAACAVGRGTIQVQRNSNGEVLHTQTFDVASFNAPPPTPIPTATPVPTATPIATPTAVATPDTSCRIDDRGTFDDRIEIDDGQWNGYCFSRGRPSGHSARFYSFKLNKRSNLTIDLDSNIDAYLLVRNGVGKSASIMIQDDDGGPGTDSHIERYFDPGAYTVEATTYYADREGTFVLTIDGPVREVFTTNLTKSVYMTRLDDHQVTSDRYRTRATVDYYNYSSDGVTMGDIMLDVYPLVGCVSNVMTYVESNDPARYPSSLLGIGSGASIHIGPAQCAPSPVTYHWPVFEGKRFNHAPDVSNNDIDHTQIHLRAYPGDYNSFPTFGWDIAFPSDLADGISDYCVNQFPSCE